MYFPESKFEFIIDLFLKVKISRLDITLSKNLIPLFSKS